MNAIFDCMLLFVWIVHLWLAPFTKVEESFNTQAVHDIIFHQLNISQYDHLEFPGVVPRTFFGPAIVSAVSYPLIKIIQTANLSKFWALLAARSSLGLIVFMCFRFFLRSVRKTFGHSVANWLILITISQFHLNFYATRLLPNVFALSLVLLVYGFLLANRNIEAIWSAVFSAVVFRSELVLLYAPLFLYVLWKQNLTIWNAIVHGICSLVISLAITVPVDSFFWQKLLWPEGQVWYYNVVLNKSSDWGTSPFLWYFYSALPRALLSTLVISIFGFIMDKRIRYFMGSILLFIFAYSFLPHKELRFIIYTFPIFNLSAAYICQLFWRKRQTFYIMKFIHLALVGQLAVNALASFFFLYVSMNNYPGGVAMMQLHEIKSPTDPIRIHIDVYNAQTGISRFLHMNEEWEYNKTESLVQGDLELLNFDCILVGGEIENATEFYSQTHKTKFLVNSFQGFHPKIMYEFPFMSLNLKWLANVALFCR